MRAEGAEAGTEQVLLFPCYCRGALVISREPVHIFSFAVSSWSFRLFSPPLIAAKTFRKNDNNLRLLYILSKSQNQDYYRDQFWPTVLQLSIKCLGFLLFVCHLLIHWMPMHMELTQTNRTDPMLFITGLWYFRKRACIFLNWISYNFCNCGICNWNRFCIFLLTNSRSPQLQFTQACK